LFAREDDGPVGPTIETQTIQSDDLLIKPERRKFLFSEEYTFSAPIQFLDAIFLSDVTIDRKTGEVVLSNEELLFQSVGLDQYRGATRAALPLPDYIRKREFWRKVKLAPVRACFGIIAVLSAFLVLGASVLLWAFFISDLIGYQSVGVSIMMWIGNVLHSKDWRSDGFWIAILWLSIWVIDWVFGPIFVWQIGRHRRLAAKLAQIEGEKRLRREWFWFVSWQRALQMLNASLIFGFIAFCWSATPPGSFVPFVLEFLKEGLFLLPGVSYLAGAIGQSPLFQDMPNWLLVGFRLFIVVVVFRGVLHLRTRTRESVA